MESKPASSHDEFSADTDTRHSGRVVVDEEKNVGHPQYLQIEENESLQKEQSVDVDVTNRNAIKGDESDGKVDWTWNQILATVCLSGLYVGTLTVVGPAATPIHFAAIY
jgi:hypothetical protein